VHIPFCESLCYYCACNKIITKHHDAADAYLRYLSREVDLHTQHMGMGQSSASCTWAAARPPSSTTTSCAS
jgi:oxygen-independent coproporphyrinogen-3 oxidase